MREVFFMASLKKSTIEPDLRYGIGKSVGISFLPDLSPNFQLWPLMGYGKYGKIVLLWDGIGQVQVQKDMSS